MSIVEKIKDVLSDTVIVRCTASCANLTWSLEAGQFYELSRQRFSEIRPHVVELVEPELSYARKHLGDIHAEEIRAEEAESARQRKQRLEQIARTEAQAAAREEQLDRQYEPLMSRISRRFGLAGK